MYYDLKNLKDILLKYDFLIDNLRILLKDVLTEVYKCIVIFKIIVEKLESSGKIKESITSNLNNNIDNFIMESKFSNVPEENYKVYEVLMDELSKELKIDIKIIVKIFKTIQNEEVYDEISKKVKQLFGIDNNPKNIKKKQLNKETNTQGVKLVAQKGVKLTRLEEMHNLTNTKKTAKIDEHIDKMHRIVKSYNDIHKNNPINQETIRNALELWKNIYSSDNSKKHIDNYIAYALKLIDPKIKMFELERALNAGGLSNTVNQNTIYKYYSDFFNNNSGYDLYAERNRNNANGFIFNNDKLIEFLQNYKPEAKSIISEKILNELKGINNIDALIREMEKHDLITSYIKHNNNYDGPKKRKLTKKEIKDIVKEIIE